jgi:hypothetical protein
VVPIRIRGSVTWALAVASRRVVDVYHSARRSDQAVYDLRAATISKRGGASIS